MDGIKQISEEELSLQRRVDSPVRKLSPSSFSFIPPPTHVSEELLDDVHVLPEAPLWPADIKLAAEKRSPANGNFAQVEMGSPISLSFSACRNELRVKASSSSSAFL